jgi:phospholipid transport system substrate-binding protein
MQARRTVLTRSLGLLAGLLLLAGTAAASAHAADAGAFVESLGNRAIAQLTDKSLSDQERERRFRGLLVENFDIPAIGKFVLGRYWKTASGSQQSSFLQVFEDVLVKRFTPMFAKYGGETFEICRVVQDPDPKYSTVCSVVTSPDGEPVNVYWRTRAGGAGLKIIDVVVEGASMAITLRSEYSSVIQNSGGNVDTLITSLREKIAS